MTEESRIKRFDDTAYDVVVFDEIFLMDTRKLARIKRYAEEHPEKLVIATGDTEPTGAHRPHDQHLH
jgi:ATP:corrinoid adenosyltransferase